MSAVTYAATIIACANIFGAISIAKCVYIDAEGLFGCIK